MRKNTGVVIIKPEKRQKIAKNFSLTRRGNRMKIANDKSDALELVRRIHAEMNILRKALAELEYLVYETDDRVSIEVLGEVS
jgi:hypothetical protein